MALSAAHVSFSSSGGAGAVASRLAQEQNQRGIESRLFSVINRDLRAEPFSAPIHTALASLDQYVIKNPDFESPISLLRDLAHPVDWRKLSEFDVVHLHGVNGALDLEMAAKHLVNTRLVWTLHDMNPFTGVCHYSLECDGFTRSCGSCPATRTIFQPLAEKALAKKRATLSRLNNLAVVSPSRWLASEAARSSLFANREIGFINNPVGIEFFDTEVTRTAPPTQGSLVVGVIAQNLSDPRKNVGEAHRAFVELLDSGIAAHMFLIGSGGDEFVGPYVHLLGALSAQEIIPHLDSWDVLINPSRAENAPLAIAEAAARGCRAFVADEGGMPSMVSELGIGSVYQCESELTHLLAAQARVPRGVGDRHRCDLSARARALYSVSSVVDAYLRFY